MVDDANTLISVRGDAERIVAPDAAGLSVTASASADSAGAASTKVAAALSRVLDALGELGGEPLTITSVRAPLTWSTRSLNTHEEHDGKRRTGRWYASAAVTVTVRAFELLDRVSQLLASHDQVSINSVSWSVDDDNPAWSEVRADAIRAALVKGRDYAAALGGAVIGVEHVADSGLLGADSADGFRRSGASARGFAAAGMPAGGAEVDGVSLDPVPQRIAAVIEARVSATVGPLPD